MPGPSTIFILGKSYGTSFHAEKWLSLDVCGLMGATCSWGVHIYALIVVAAKLLSNSWIAIVIYVAFYVPAALLAMASLFKAWTTDPGAVPLGARPLTIVRRASSSSVGSNGNSESDASPSLTSRRAMRRCHKCNNNYKPPRAHHDSVTGRCIVKFDHFCPWVGNAVGALNHKFFCLFLFYTAITCLFSILLLILRAFHCGYTIEPDEGKEAFEGGEGRARALGSSSIYKFPECNSFYSSHLVIGLIICSLVFLVFTLTMGCEQIEAVQTGKSKIARMKMRVGNAGTEFRAVTEDFNEIFGGESPEVSLHWFLPLDVKFPRGMKKVVLGYEWDPSFDPEPFEPSESGSLGDHEMIQLEQGQISTDPTRPANDVLLTRESEVSLTDASVHSDASASSGIKNRKSPPNSRPSLD